MCAKFSVHYAQMERLEQNIQKLPNRSEKILNEVLQVKVSPLLERSILGLIPLSDRKKKHAKRFKSLAVSNKINLTILLKPKPKYQYLVFPDLGLGTSIKNAPQRFMEHGIERETKKTIEECNKALIEEINRTLGGK